MAQTSLTTPSNWNRKSTTVVTDLTPMQKPQVILGILASIQVPYLKKQQSLFRLCVCY